MPFLTPLRYPGGKGKLTNFMKLIFLNNNLLDAVYIEPYAGGAGIALSLLFNEFASHIYINDLNHSLFAFWHTVLNNTDELCKRIQDTPVVMEEWYRQKEVQEKSDHFSLFDLGFSTFFLKLTNRSGIIKGGVIGGKNQNGPYALDARFNKEDLIKRIRKIGRFRERISVFNLDAAEFIRQMAPQLNQKSLFYLDPPYYIKGQGLYENYYESEDHLEVARLVANLQQHWIVTYDNTPEIQEMYAGYRQISYNLNYSAAERYTGSEVMFFSNQLVVPPVETPALIKARFVRQAMLPI